MKNKKNEKSQVFSRTNHFSKKQTQTQTMQPETSDSHHNLNQTITASELMFRLSGADVLNNKSANQQDNRESEEKEQQEKLSSTNNNRNDDDYENNNNELLSPPPLRDGVNSKNGSPFFKPDPNFHFYEVETYENWRWYPVIGWSQNLLPTDRYTWSSEDGKTEVTKESYEKETKKLVVFSNKEDGNDDKIFVPAYDWVGDWEVFVEKDKSDADGWRYARDFPCEYFPENFFGVCVRRRLWIRRFRVPRK